MKLGVEGSLSCILRLNFGQSSGVGWRSQEWFVGNVWCWVNYSVISKPEHLVVCVS